MIDNLLDYSPKDGINLKSVHVRFPNSGFQNNWEFKLEPCRKGEYKKGIKVLSLCNITGFDVPEDMSIKFWQIYGQ